MAALLDDLRDYWHQRLRQDLSPFADPGTQLDLISEGRTFNAHWTFRDQPYEARFEISLETGVRVSFRRQSMSYSSFLASADLGDLNLLAKMMLRSTSPQFYVATKAKRSDQYNSEASSAVTLLQNLLDHPDDSGVTRLAFVTGEPGAGKTRVLQELVRLQAQRYIERRSDRLYLYVNAQGRALARFHEALAVELNDLRATLPHHAVATLVRAGLLVPVIDGFDELLGVSGYDDAFSSLAGFIEELEGLGQIVASARSTYYEQEFASRAGSVSSLGSQSWSLTPIEVLGWGDEEFEAYLRVLQTPSFATSNALRDHLRRVFQGPNKDFKSKPLFVVRAADLILAGNDLHPDSDLLEELVVAYLERERSQKLLDRNNTPLLTAQQITLLLTTLAEEMWNSETRELDQRFVRDIAAFNLEAEGISSSSAEVVKQRIPSFAFLRRGDTTGRIAFEHEIFFAYFLAKTFAARLGGPVDNLRLLLSRSILPADVARLTLSSLMGHDSELVELVLDDTLEKLGLAAGSEGPRSGQVRENAGILVAISLKEGCGRLGELNGKRIRNVSFPGVDLAGITLNDSILEGLEFRRVDLTNTRFLRCRSITSYFLDVIVDPSRTRLELTGLDAGSHVQGLRQRVNDVVEPVYDPIQLHNALAACGAVEPLPLNATTIRLVDKRVVTLLERLARAYRRSNPVCKADANLRALFSDEKWPDLEKALVSSDVISRETRATGGPKKEFLRRRVLPEDIMAGANKDNEVPTQVRRLWDELERRFPG